MAMACLRPLPVICSKVAINGGDPTCTSLVPRSLIELANVLTDAEGSRQS